MKTFSRFTLYTYNNTSLKDLDVPWPQLQLAVGESAFRYLLNNSECEVYIEHDDAELGFPTSRVVVEFLTQSSQEQFQKMREHK